jgi:cytochrome bd ubiquinol oxidase subunit II
MDMISFFQNAWFILIGILLTGYAILDGFDLGIGILLPLLAKDDNDTKTVFDTIWPFWDGNEVWLITGGGALFAAFPHVYATVFSGFYLALMLVLFALILRAVSMEFWYYDICRRKIWSAAFTIGSFLPSLLYGVALGNVIIGVPLNSSMEYTGNFFTLLRPFPLSIGILGLAAILLHGSTYAVLKTEGDINGRARKLSVRLWYLFITALLFSFIMSVIYQPDSIKGKLVWISAAIIIVPLIMYIQFVKVGSDFSAFIMSSLIFAGLWGHAGIRLYPNLVRASNDPSLSLTLSNSSSSLLTLKFMFIIALIGMPIVIAYTVYAYRIFKGKSGPLPTV